jgi:hypothetical protein
MHQSHHPGFADVCVNAVNAANLQRFNDSGGRVNFFKSKLGIGMQITAKRSELWVKLCNVSKGAAMR